MAMSETQTAELLGISQQRLSYWLRTEALHVEGGGEVGNRCHFHPADVMRALTVKELLEEGAKLKDIRKAARALEDLHNIDDWQTEWLCVEPGTGEVTWYNSDREALLRLKDSQVYLLDVNGLKDRVKKELRRREGMFAGLD